MTDSDAAREEWSSDVCDARLEQAAFACPDMPRLVAAATVVLNHVRRLLLVDSANDRNSSLGAKIIHFAGGFGHQGAMIFFVLSGFWINRRWTSSRRAARRAVFSRRDHSESECTT